jgi:hypothetical protein
MVGVERPEEEKSGVCEDYKVVAEKIRAWSAMYPSETIILDIEECYCPDPCGSAYVYVKPIQHQDAAVVEIHASTSVASYGTSVLTGGEKFFIGCTCDLDKVTMDIELWGKDETIDLTDLLSAVVAGDVEMRELFWQDWTIWRELTVQLSDGRKVKTKNFPNLMAASLSVGGLAALCFCPSGLTQRIYRLPGYLDTR